MYINLKHIKRVYICHTKNSLIIITCKNFIFHIDHKKFILLFYFLSKLFITFFFKALALFNSLRSLSRLFHSLIDRTVNVRPPSVSFL